MDFSDLKAEIIPENDTGKMRELLALFARAFDDDESYLSAQPSDEYLTKLLASETFVAVAAYVGDAIAGGLAGYVLQKFEQERAEFYIYDLAVAEEFRRRGVATALIEEVKTFCRSNGVYVIFVQADTTPDDEPAIPLYTKLGTREDVLHFDITP